MKEILFLFVVEWYPVFTKQIWTEDPGESREQKSSVQRSFYNYLVPVVPFKDEDEHYKYKNLGPNPLPSPTLNLNDVINNNPLLAVMLISTSLGAQPKSTKANHPDLVPINPYIALLLSQYGRYLPQYGTGRGLYGYSASNNYHNNQPLGSYKIYEDSDD